MGEDFSTLLSTESSLNSLEPLKKGGGGSKRRCLINYMNKKRRCIKNLELIYILSLRKYNFPHTYPSNY